MICIRNRNRRTDAKITGDRQVSKEIYRVQAVFKTLTQSDQCRAQTTNGTASLSAKKANCQTATGARAEGAPPCDATVHVAVVKLG